MAQHRTPSRTNDLHGARMAMLLVVIAGAPAMLVGCDDRSSDANLTKAANQLRIAPALGIDEDGNDLVSPAYAQAASTAQASSQDAAALIAADAAAAQAQHALKTAASAWFGITSETTSGQALLIRLANEQARLVDLQAFDPSPVRAEISARRTLLQQSLREAESGLDETTAELGRVDARIAGLRDQARAQRDAAEDLRERATAIGGTQRAVLIAQANERQRESDAFEQQAAEAGLGRDRVGFAEQRARQQIDSLRRQLESLMQRERALEADIASRSQQATGARDSVTQLTGRIADQINTMAERYNTTIAPSLSDAITGFEAAASRARQGQNAIGGTAKLSVGTNEHALALTHRAHATMLESMLSFVDQALARGVTSGTIQAIRTELDAKLAEANAAAAQAAEQASGSLAGAGATGNAGEILNQVAEALFPTGSRTNPVDADEFDQDPNLDEENPESTDDDWNEDGNDGQ